MTIPQLRIRTEYSFKSAFGPLPRVLARLNEIGARFAGMVEAGGGTWGHVQWEKQAAAAGITPGFGAEFIVRGDNDARPVCWVLAEDTAALYRETTAGWAAKHYASTTTVERMAAARGLIRFAGSALVDPAAFDYIDLSLASPLSLRRSLALAKRTGRPTVITSDNAFPCPSDEGAYRVFGRLAKPTRQWILSDDELREAFRALTEEEWRAAVRGTREVAERLQGVKLRKAPMIAVKGNLRRLCEAGRKRRAIAAWDERYDARLKRELDLIAEKEFESYFLVVADLVQWAKKRMLVGPARGSAAGSLVCYLLGITEVDPIPFGLIFERFVDVTRKDLPDIDLDFPDAKRDQCYTYLANKYGAEHVARIGTISTFKPRSALIEACKAFDIPPHESAAVKAAMFIRSSGDSRANNCLIDTMRETEPGRDFLARHPEMEVAGEIEGHASHAGVHAAGVCLCNEPISNFATVEEGIMQLDKYDAEALNLLKIDALGLRTLGVIEDAGVVTPQQLYSLPLDDPAAYAVIDQHRFAGVFQWEGFALQSITKFVRITRFADLDQITALARPGPLGGGAADRYVERHEGRERWTYPHPSMATYLDESFGLVLYQEQVLRLCREIGGMSWEDVTLLRKAMSKSYGKEYFDQFRDKFMDGAARLHGIDAASSQAMWDAINSMGMWSFNKAHSVSYALISYWTAWLKAHHPLEYAAAALRGAADDIAVLESLRELAAEGVEYTAFDPELSEVNWSVKDGKLIGGFLNLVGFGPVKAIAAVEARRLGKMTPKMRERIAAAEIKFAELYPLHRQYAAIYADPEAHGCRPGSKILDLAALPEAGDVLFIGRITTKDLRDVNEPTLVARRNGRHIRKGPTEFMDMKMADDSTANGIRVRVDRFDFDRIGRLLMERAKEGEDVFLVRGEKLRGYPMVRVERIRCLTRPEILES